MFPTTWSLVLSPRLGRYDSPPFLGLTGCHDLAVMLENHPRRIAHLQRDLSGTFAFCQAVAGEAVAQRILWPLEAAFLGDLGDFA